jgi:hypothetical protein
MVSREMFRGVPFRSASKEKRERNVTSNTQIRVTDAEQERNKVGAELIKKDRLFFPWIFPLTAVRAFLIAVRS